MTFTDKLREMRKDLASIVDRMNRDRSYEKAAAAQKALLAIAELESEGYSWFDELEWEWQPSEEDN